MNTEKIGKIIGEDNGETLENPKESIDELKKLIAQKDFEIERLKRENDGLREMADGATGLAEAIARKVRKTSTGVNRRNEEDLTAARGDRDSNAEKLFNAECLIRELEELQAKAALAILDAYQNYYNSLYKDEINWTSIQRRVIGILKSIMDQAGLIFINPVKNVQFNHTRHSANPVPIDAWRRTDDSEKDLDRTLIESCIAFGIKEKDDLHGNGIVARVFKRAQVVLQRKK